MRSARLLKVELSAHDRLYYSSWQALVHFIYTGTIHFAPLKSQGLELRREEQNQHREKNQHLPPLCSPKSVYRLAEFVSRR